MSFTVRRVFLPAAFELAARRMRAEPRPHARPRHTTGEGDHRVSHPYAQTNLQLYHQLEQHAYSRPDQLVIREAYELAILLFGDLFRPNGKPFLNHAVGTASILVTLQQPVTVIAAALLHAAYSHGNFGAASGSKREFIHERMGPEIEALIWQYRELVWSPASIERLRDELQGLDTQEAAALRIRLANELEDHLDLGMLYASKGKYSGRLAPCVNAVLEIAGEVAGSEFRDDLSKWIQLAQQGRVNPALQSASRKSYALDRGQRAPSRIATVVRRFCSKSRRLAARLPRILFRSP